MKKIIPIILVILFSAVVKAQQYPHITMYSFYSEFSNPAAINTDYKWNAGTIGRKQWAQFEGSPLMIGAFGDFTFKNKVSTVGFQYNYDQLGSFKFNSLRFIYNHNIPISRELKLQVALAPDIIFATVNNNFIANDPNDPALPPSGITTEAAFSFSGGIYMYSKDFKLGLSSVQILQSKMDVLNYNLTRHYFVMAAYNFKLGHEFILTPQVQVKTDGISTQLDGNLQAEWKEKIIAGIGYRLTDAFTFMVGYKFKKCLLLAAYDHTVSEIREYSIGSYELIFRWWKGYPKKRFVNIHSVNF